MSVKKVVILASFILAIGCFVLAYTDWPASVPALRYVALQFCGRSSGLYYISYGPTLPRLNEVRRIDENYQVKPVNLRPELGKDRVVVSPDGRRLAYSIHEAESPRQQLYMACADGSRSFTVTGWNEQLFFYWLNADLLVYGIGSYRGKDIPPDTDVREYVLDTRTGEVKDKGNPFEYRYVAWNPGNPDLGGFFKWYGSLWLENTRTGQRTDGMEISEEWGGGADGEWSPDGRRLAFWAYQPTGPHAWKNEIYLVDADGSNLHQVSDFETNYPGFSPSEFTWSPDGQWLALLAHKDDDPNDRRLLVLSLGEGKLIDMGLEWDNPFWPVWSPDSRQIAFTSYLIHEGQNDVYTIETATKQVRQVTDTPESEGSLSWR